MTGGTITGTITLAGIIVLGDILYILLGWRRSPRPYRATQRWLVTSSLQEASRVRKLGPNPKNAASNGTRFGDPGNLRLVLARETTLASIIGRGHDRRASGAALSSHCMKVESYTASSALALTLASEAQSSSASLGATKL